MERAKIQKNICKNTKITQHEEMFFKLSFKGMIRFDLNMEHDEVYGKFVFDRLYLFNFVFLQKIC